MMPATGWVRIVLIVAAVVAIGIVALTLRSCGAAPAEQKAATAQIQQASAESFTEAAQDATAITGNTMDAERTIDRQTEVNHETISRGDGSNAVALRALCLRAAYRNQPRCTGMLKARAGSNP
jgi:uncharacterized membrane protein YoaK (UPF0700 family)